jgi:hypothetical protein
LEIVIVGPLARETEDGAFARSELHEGLFAKAADGLATLAARFDDAGGTETAEVPRDKRLAEADMGDQFRDGRLALREAAHDAQPVDVGHDLVKGAQLAQVVGLGDGRSDRAADPGGRRGQGWGSGLGWADVVASTTIYINRR